MGDTTSTEFNPQRERLRAVLAQRSMSVADASRLSGIAMSTLAAWLGGKYTGRNDRIADEVEKWLRGLEEQAQARAIGSMLPQFVTTPTASAFLAVLQHAQFVPDIAVITGGAGVGKTTTCEEYQRTHANVWIFTAEPATRKMSAALDGVCEALGMTWYTPSRRTHEIIKRVRGSGGLLIIDEANHLESEALNQIRTIHDKSGLGIALVGNSEVYARIGGGGRKAEFAQLYSRVGMKLHRGQPLKEDVELLLDAATIDGQPERKLLRAITRKPGALRGLKKVLRVAQMLAAADNIKDPTEKHFSESWKQISDNAPIGESV